MSTSISGAAGVYFVAGELSRKGYIALTTTRNTKGIDLIVSDTDFTRTVYLQVKTNRYKYDFWIVGKPNFRDNLFYVFVNLLGDQEKPEYYVVPSKDVYQQFQDWRNRRKYEELSDADRAKIVDLVKSDKTAWKIAEELKVVVSAVRKIAQERGLRIKYDRGKGEKFPFSFTIRRDEESRYKSRWDLLGLG
jgi:hypothetical protein